MFFKLSLRNVRKSFSDYTLYFLTLTFGVCIFYVFNSIEAQKAMLQISESALEIMKSITWIMNIVSIFISFILGFLIVYANNFLIKRRKREFGIYMTLGMARGKISRVLVAETFIIGVFSLAVGLLAGIFVSQGLSVVTAKLFEVDMTSFTFVFSLPALLKTIGYFGIIFVIAIAANAFTISKYKLIELINAAKKNEKQRVKHPAVTVMLFILSVAFICTAYAMVLKNGIATFDSRLLVECAFGAVGTFLFFASLSGFLLRLIQANKRLYYKKLNMFILRQINSRINTAFVSMSFICLMLFTTIGIFSTGIGMTSVLNRSYKDAAPFDLSIMADGDINISDVIKDSGLDVGDYAESKYQYKLYEDESGMLNFEQIFGRIESSFPEKDRQQIRDKIYPMPLHFIALSDFNELMSLQKKAGITLRNDQVALMTQYTWADADFQEYLNKYMELDNTMTVGGTVYNVSPEMITVGVSNNSRDILTLIVPDAAVAEREAYQTVLCVNCRGNAVKAEDAFVKEFDALQLSSGQANKLFEISTKNELLAQEGGSKAMISFVGIYVGLVFLITSAAILALQQLSEAADNRQRYAVLQKIGADGVLINRTIFKQTAIYFLIPLIVACVHSVVGIKVANDAIRMVGSLNAGSNIILTAIIILAIYGGYFIATYIGNKKIILRGT